MSSAMLREVASQDRLDGLDELRYKLLRISTSGELDDDQRESHRPYTNDGRQFLILN